jgi:hypothetical protein
MALTRGMLDVVKKYGKGMTTIQICKSRRACDCKQLHSFAWSRIRHLSEWLKEPISDMSLLTGAVWIRGLYKITKTTTPHLTE